MTDRLIAAGIRNLQEFGYPSVNAQNIITDRIYRAFFRRMLEDNLGKGVDGPIRVLMAQIDAQPEPVEDAPKRKSRRRKGSR